MRAFYSTLPAAEIFQTVSGKSAAPGNVETPSGKLLPATRVVDVTVTAPDYTALATRFTLPWSTRVRLLSVKTAAARAFLKPRHCAKAGRCASSTARSVANSFSLRDIHCTLYRIHHVRHEVVVLDCLLVASVTLDVKQITDTAD